MNGTITKRARKDGKPSWAYVFDAGKDESGKRQQLTKSSFTTKREAEDGLRKAIAAFELKRDEKPVATLPTFTEFFETWMEQRASRKCQRKTLERYRELAAYAIVHLGSTPIDKLEPRQIQQAINAIHDAGGRVTKDYPTGRPLAPKTVRDIGFLVHNCLQTAVLWGNIAVNPMDRVELPEPVKFKPQVLDRDKLEVLLQAASGLRMFPLIMLAAATGCRRGELLALQWSDIDFETGMLSITKSLEETREGLRIKSTKSGEPRRISLPKQAVNALMEHREEQASDSAMFGADYANLGLVFARPNGNYYTPDKMSARVTELSEKAGLKGVGLHSLRHSHASELLSKGAPITTVSKRLGHANPNITLSIYSHALEADELAAAKIWDDAMVNVIDENRRKPKSMLANVSTNISNKTQVFDNKDGVLVGAAGFELATLCSQSRCATRLRYAPTCVTSFGTLRF